MEKEQTLKLLEVDKEFFDATIPAARTVSDEIWQDMATALTAAVAMTPERLTGTMDISGNTPLIACLKRLACYEAMRDTIAQRDLILTPNGFGVVSNNNVVPASRDRVDAFRQSLESSASRCFDDAITMLRNVEGWANTGQARTVIASAMYLSNHMVYAGTIKPTREDLHEAMPRIVEAETAIACLISRQQYEEFIAALRSNPVIPASYATLHLKVLRYVGSAVAGINKHTLQSLLREIIRFIEDNIADFGTCSNSAEWRASHHQGYENRREDPCYFF